MEILKLVLMPILSVVLAIVALSIAYRILMAITEVIGTSVIGTIVVALIVPGAMSANRAIAAASKVDWKTNHDKVEKMREAITADAIRSAKLFKQYPQMAGFAHKLAKF